MYPFERTDIDFAIWFTVALGFAGTFFPYLLMSWFTTSDRLLNVVRIGCVVLLIYGLASVYDRYVRDEPQFALSYEERLERIRSDLRRGSDSE